MNIINQKVVCRAGRTVATVILVQLPDGLRLVYKFGADESNFHDAAGGCSLFGDGTRLQAVSDASIVEQQYADTRFRECVSAL